MRNKRTLLCWFNGCVDVSCTIFFLLNRERFLYIFLRGEKYVTYKKVFYKIESLERTH